MRKKKEGENNKRKPTESLPISFFTNSSRGCTSTVSVCEIYPKARRKRERGRERGWSVKELSVKEKEKAHQYLLEALKFFESLTKLLEPKFYRKKISK